MKPLGEQPKEKKITVSLYLNKKLNPTGVTTNEKGKNVNMYPLYLTVTYNRKSTQFKSYYAMPYSDISEVPLGLKNFEERIVTKIIQFEIARQAQGEEFDMKGLKEKYEAYVISIYTCLETYLKSRLRLEILKTNDELFKALDLHKGDGKNSVMLLYRAAGKLFDNFQGNMDSGLKGDIEIYGRMMPLFHTDNYEFPTLLDWLDGSMQEELKTLVPNDDMQGREFIDKAKKLIGEAVVKMLKQLGG